MKAFYKVSVLGCLLVAMIVSASTVSIAQAQDEKAKLYQEVVDNYPYATSYDANDIASMEEALPKVKKAISSGEAFKAKFNTADNEAIIQWIDGQMPSWKEAVSTMEKRIPALKKAEEEAKIRNERFQKFDAAYKSKNWDALFQVGDEIVSNYTDVALDVSLQLAKTSFDLVYYDSKDAYVPKASQYSNKALMMLDSGKTSKNYGVFDRFKTEKHPDGKSNAIGNINFQVGWLKYYKENQKEKAVPYMYKTSKVNSDKQIDITYSTIGRYYVAEVTKLIEKQNGLLAERNAEADKEDPDVEKVKQLDYQVDMIIATMKGYADRAIDAYLRGYSKLSADEKNSDYGKNMFNRISQLYKVRHPGKTELQTPDKINMDLAAVASRVMPDPSSKVMPIDAPLKPAPKTESTEEKDGETRSRTVSNGNN